MRDPASVNIVPALYDEIIFHAARDIIPSKEFKQKVISYEAVMCRELINIRNKLPADILQMVDVWRFSYLTK